MKEAGTLVPTIRIGVDAAAQVCSVLYSLPWVVEDSVIAAAIGRNFQPAAAAAEPFLRAALENRNKELPAWQCLPGSAESLVSKAAARVDGRPTGPAFAPVVWAW
jgi:hypothetical protein